MEFVMVNNGFRGVTLIWMMNGESGLIKEFRGITDAMTWAEEAGITYRWARPEEVQD
jgi:hypothetical protein